MLVHALSTLLPDIKVDTVLETHDHEVQRKHETVQSHADYIHALYGQPMLREKAWNKINKFMTLLCGCLQNKAAIMNSQLVHQDVVNSSEVFQELNPEFHQFGMGLSPNF